MTSVRNGVWTLRYSNSVQLNRPQCLEERALPDHLRHRDSILARSRNCPQLFKACHEYSSLLMARILANLTSSYRLACTFLQRRLTVDGRHSTSRLAATSALGVPKRPLALPLHLSCLRCGPATKSLLRTFCIHSLQSWMQFSRIYEKETDG